MALTEAQQAYINTIKADLIALEALDGFNPNADEIIAISNDLGQKAAAGAADLADSLLQSVSGFLNSLFDG